MRASTSAVPAAAVLEAPDQDSSHAFWQRWQVYRQPLLRLARRLLGSQSPDAEDAVTCALLRALQQRRPAAVSVANERAWLSRILYNVCMDMHRQRWRFTEPAPPGNPELLEERPDMLPSAVVASAEEELLAREQLLGLQAHIQTLPPSLRAPLVMRFYQDMSYPEISASLNLTNCNVRKRIQFAYARLRAVMGPQAPRFSNLQPHSAGVRHPKPHTTPARTS